MDTTQSQPDSKPRIQDDRPARRRRRWPWVILVVIAALVAIGGIAFTAYASDYYHADEAAHQAMEPTEGVQVRTLANGDIAFIPPSPRAGVVLYPGGKVQAEAYAPLLQALAERGFLGVLVPMPFNLAVLNMNGADGVQEQFPEVRSWVLMGHSLGGVMAAAYASSHGEEWEGLGLLGAYATSDLAESGLTVLSLSGTEDGILNRQAAASNRGNLPEGAVELSIEGGNHAQFGSYGAQSSDGTATIAPEEQRRVVADAVARTFP